MPFRMGSVLITAMSDDLLAHTSYVPCTLHLFSLTRSRNPSTREARTHREEPSRGLQGGAGLGAALPAGRLGLLVPEDARGLRRTPQPPAGGAEGRAGRTKRRPPGAPKRQGGAGHDSAPAATDGPAPPLPPAVGPPRAPCARLPVGGAVRRGLSRCAARARPRRHMTAARGRAGPRGSARCREPPEPSRSSRQCPAVAAAAPPQPCWRCSPGCWTGSARYSGRRRWSSPWWGCSTPARPPSSTSSR